MPRRVQMWAGLGVLALLVGYVVADIEDYVPGVLSRHNPAASAPTFLQGNVARQLARSSPRSSSAAPTSSPTPPMPRADDLAAALATPLSSPALGPRPGLIVTDAATGTVLAQRSATTSVTAASTTKLLAAAAITEASDVSERIRTSLQWSAPSTLTLVLRGDTLLAPGVGNPSAVAGRAGLADLASRAVQNWSQRPSGPVRLMVDDTYAAGPRMGPAWAAADVAQGFTGPIAMGGLATRRPEPGRPAAADPPMDAAAALVKALNARGVKVQGSPTRQAAPAGGQELASVDSAPVADLLTLALADSDNALTEVLTRRAAFAAMGRTDFPSVTRWVLERLRELSVSTQGAVLVDASGLSRGTAIAPRTIADVIQLAASGAHPRLAGVLAGLPVAGLSGTLDERFTRGAHLEAAGVARAKTGTLTGASSLAGYALTHQGRLLTFVIMADGVPASQGTLAARRALDTVVTTMVTCPCGAAPPPSPGAS